MFSIPNTFSIAPNLRMVETKKNSIFSLFEIYTEMNKKTNKTKVSWIHEDIDFWFSVLNTCIIVGQIYHIYFSISQNVNACIFCFVDWKDSAFNGMLTCSKQQIWLRWSAEKLGFIDIPIAIRLLDIPQNCK